MNNCSICLKRDLLTTSVKDVDKNNVKWLCKLQYIIPELVWLDQYVICNCCIQQLENAYKFKHFVLAVEKERKYEVIKNEFLEIDSKIENTFSKIQCCNSNKGELFTCYNCNVSFNSKDQLINHIEIGHKEIELMSNSAIEKYEGYDINYMSQNCVYSEDELNGYVVQDESKYCCSTCTNKYSTQEMLTSHIKMCKSKVNDAHLTTCLEKSNKDDESFPESRVRETSEIKKRRGRKPTRRFTCEICNEEFDYVKLVIEHCVSVHAMDTKLVKPYSCEKCDMRFVSSANLDQHRNYHNKNRTHICSLCGKGFITKSDLTVHEYTHYNRRNYKCSMCDKAFNTNKNLRTHNLVVHTDRSLWKYACSICEKRFPLKTNYDQHLRRHTGEKEHPCHICKKPFISKSELQRHIHMHSNIRAFKCSNCDKEYKERRTYVAHLAKKHGIGNAKVTVREKRFVCHICPSQFYDKQKLMRHICSHSGLKPFPCYMCDKKFTDKSYLKHHLKTAHNISDELLIGNI